MTIIRQHLTIRQSSNYLLQFNTEIVNTTNNKTVHLSKYIWVSTLINLTKTVLNYFEIEKNIRKTSSAKGMNVLMSVPLLNTEDCCNYSKKHSKSRHRRFSARKGVVRNFAKFTWKHLCHSLFFNKVYWKIY